MALSSSRASLLPLLCLLLLAAAAAAASHHREHRSPASHPLTLPGCPDKCGDVSIPYPFGTKDGCFRPGFYVVCNNTFHIRPAPSSTPAYSENVPTETEPVESEWPIELTGVFFPEGKAWLLGGFSYECILNETHHSVRRQSINTGDDDDDDDDASPFILSDADNVLVGIGSDVVADQTNGPLCQSFLSDDPMNGSCAGLGCCQTNVHRFRSGSEVTIEKGSMMRDGVDDDYVDGGGVSCSYAMIVEKTWYNFSTVDLDSDAFLQRNAAGVVPIVVDFIIGLGGCPKPGEPTPKDFACISDNSQCVDRPAANHAWKVSTKPAMDTKAHYCNCSVGYQGNPYIREGCQDIDECARSEMYPCHGKCKNTPGDYECSCPAGMRGNAKEGLCTELFSLPSKISVGMVGGLLIIALLVFTILIRNEKSKVTEFFNKNGGPTLEKAKIIKIYRKGELNPILKPSNFIGRGAFGEVYKGYLDNQLVAIKKPIDGIADVAQNNQFTNEVIIQSQVIHKNIVKLIGCCLEVDKPMLVYEFLSKGSLDNILHGSSCAPITLECRLNIAAESAEGLAYLHSKTTNTILHGDVKPANILLNDSFTPKICDFGISRLIVIDKEHTDFVIGDRTYMDPVYLRDGLLTDKSDVYSFGVVLLELISRKKATYSDNNSLVRSFLDAHKRQKEATELFDKEIAKPEVLKLLNSLYEIAVNCLNLDVDKRPNMIEVAESLLMLKRSWSNTLTSHVPIE